MRGCKQLWNFWSTPYDLSLLFIHVLVNLLMIYIIHVVFRINFIFSKHSKILFEFSGFQAISANNDQINFVFSKDFFELLNCIIMLFLFAIIMTLSLLLSLTIISRFASSRCNQMQKFFVTTQITKLVNNSHSGHIISIVYWMKNCTHNCNSLSLRNDIIIHNLCFFLIALVSTVISDCEIAHLNHILVFFSRLLDHIILSIFFQFFLNFINNTLNKWLFNFASNHTIVMTKDALNFFSTSTPFIL